MARRKTFKQKLITGAAVVAVLGVGVAVYSWPDGKADAVAKVPEGAATPAKPQAANGATTKPAAVKPNTPTPLAAVEKVPAVVTVTPTTKPAGLQANANANAANDPARPAANPASPPPPAKPAPAVTGDAVAIFADVDAKRKADDLIAARDLLVAALAQKKFSGVHEDEAMRRLSEINGVVVFSPRTFLSDVHAVSHVVATGENLQKIANKYDTTVGLLKRINGITDERRLQAGKSIKVVRGPFHARVNKKEFTLDAYLGGKPGEPNAVFVRRFRVGLGSQDSTPTGEWKVDTKQVNPTYYNPREDGPRVIAGDDPKNPLGERWIALVGTGGQAVGKTSYGIHGTIEPDSIGQMKSLGCVRMLNEDVEVVYDMLIKDKSTVAVVE